MIAQVEFQDCFGSAFLHCVPNGGVKLLRLVVLKHALRVKAERLRTSTTVLKDA